MRDYLLRREFLHGIILGIAIAFTILVALIQQNPPLIEIKLPPLYPPQFPAQQALGTEYQIASRSSRRPAVD